MENFLHIVLSVVIASLIAAALIYVLYALVTYLDKRPFRRARIGIERFRADADRIERGGE